MTFLYPPVIALIALLTTAFVLPLYMRVARAVGLVDHPGDLKIHATPTPLIGGAGLLTGLLTSVLLSVGPELNLAQPLFVMLASLCGIWLLGLLDDVHPLTPSIRLAGQATAAVAAMTAGFIAIPTESLWIMAPLTFLFIIGLTNATNLLDGMDGLATGTAFLSSLGLAVAAYELGNLTAFLLTIFFASSLVGIWLYNWHPARVFLGSNGSLMIGYFLAIVVISLAHSPLVIAGLLCIVGLPLLDTMTAIVRRALAGAPLFQGDRNHLYDQMAQRGLSTRATVLICYLLTLGLIFLGLWLIHRDLVPYP